MAALCSVLLLGGCDGNTTSRSTPVSPGAFGATAPTPSPPPGPVANWRGDAIVLSRTGSGGCGWGTQTGETRAGVLWRITITGESVLMDEDIPNWPTDHIPYAGKLTGGQFTATYSQGSDYLRWVCQFKGAELTGSFSPDFSSFDAMETLTWGPPEGETTVQRRWTASRF